MSISQLYRKARVLKSCKKHLKKIIPWLFVLRKDIIAQASLEFFMCVMMTVNPRFSCFQPPNARVPCILHQVWVCSSRDQTRGFMIGRKEFYQATSQASCFNYFFFLFQMMVGCSTTELQVFQICQQCIDYYL